MNLVFRAGEGVCRLAEELLASQEGLCCMGLLVNSYLDLKLLDCLCKNTPSFHLEPDLSPVLCSISRGIHCVPAGLTLNGSAFSPES
jgi:hypothetical protein